MVNLVKPYGKNIVAVREVENRTKSGLFLSTAAAEDIAPRKAVVRAVGPDVEHIKVGDEIIFKPYAIFEIKLGKDEFFVIDAEDVLCGIELDENNVTPTGDKDGKARDN